MQYPSLRKHGNASCCLHARMRPSPQMHAPADRVKSALAKRMPMPRLAVQEHVYRDVPDVRAEHYSTLSLDWEHKAKGCTMLDPVSD